MFWYMSFLLALYMKKLVELSPRLGGLVFLHTPQAYTPLSRTGIFLILISRALRLSSSYGF